MAEPANLPEGVTQADLYEGPRVVEMPPPPPRPRPLMEAVNKVNAAADKLVQAIPAPAQVSSAPGEEKGYAAVLTAALDVLSARLLGLLAVIAACALWGFAVYDPVPLRIAAAGLFSVTVLGPIVALYWKAGVTGGGA
jgi:hypothetical protein